MGISFYPLIIFWFFLATLSGCIGQTKGKLLVTSIAGGTYEIYRIASAQPLQLVSERVGHLNIEEELKPGEYLVLADCSSETVVIRPKDTVRLITNQVEFVPPIPPEPLDRFTIQCDRYAETKNRQYLTNRYSLNVLSGKRELLVGMDPFVVDFKPNGAAPEKVSYNLAAIQVSAYDGMPPKTTYFVSPTGGRLSFTEIQDFGHWQFLMPGKYQVEVNGTKLDVTLGDQEKKIINPAFLRVTTSPDINLSLSSQIQGTPLYVELNGSHWLDLNETYPMLPGPANVRLTHNNLPEAVVFVEGETLEMRARSVLVENDCSPWQWSCLGSISVFLFEKDKAFPLLKGTTDVPLLFFREDVAVMLDGSRNIRMALPPKQDNYYKIGNVQFVPEFEHRSNLITDLARVESLGQPMEGNSLDLILDHETTMPLIAGNYRFSQYTFVTNTDGNRRKTEIMLSVRPGTTVTVPFTVLLSEKKYADYQDKIASQNKARRKNQTLGKAPYRPIAPFFIE